MAEKSAFPLNGNIVKFSLKNFRYINTGDLGLILLADWKIEPSYFKDSIAQYNRLSLNDRAKKEMNDSARLKMLLQNLSVQRFSSNNQFSLVPENSQFRNQSVPFYTNADTTAIRILKKDYSININNNNLFDSHRSAVTFQKIHSLPTDSLLKLMMHRSDNFFAEQTLLMVSNELLGYMNAEKIIDTLLKTVFKELPNKPQWTWVDGSGLSWHNLFTPRDFVVILNKMKNEFGMDRIKEIFPTGGEGTISSYYI